MTVGQAAAVLASSVLSLVGMAPAASAQTVGPGTVEVSAATGFTASRFTETDVSGDARRAPEVASLTTLTLEVDSSYFIAKRFGIGLLIRHAGASLRGEDGSRLFDVATTSYGPLVTGRVPFNESFSVTLLGSFGGARGLPPTPATDGGPAGVTALGRYWLGGGGLAIRLAAHRSFDVGVQYQRSTFRAGPGGPATTVGSLLTTVAFSLYFGR